jgi:hypothetical protein
MTPRRVEVTVQTRTLRGTSEQSAGDDLTIVRTYSAKEPAAFRDPRRDAEQLIVRKPRSVSLNAEPHTHTHIREPPRPPSER